MNLLLLPQEIQLEVMRTALPCDLHSLAQTCKAMLDMARTVFEEREYKLRKAYYKVGFWGKSSETDLDVPPQPASVAELLCRIGADPQIAGYIVHLNLYGRNEPNGDEWEGGSLDDEDDDDGEAESGDAHPIRKLLRESVYLARLGDRELFADEMFDAITNEDREIDAAVVFLLTLLPNLESLALYADWTTQTVVPDPERVPDAAGDDETYQFDRHIHDLISLLIERANDETRINQPLSKLRVLHPTYNIIEQCGENMLTIVPFLALKSLREARHEHACCEIEKGNNSGPVHGANKPTGSNDSSAEENMQQSEEGEDDNRGESDFDDGIDDDQRSQSARDSGFPYTVHYDGIETRTICSRYPVLGPNIEHLKLEYCVMDARACEVFFRNMKHLKTLHFDYAMKDWFGEKWDINGFVRSLANTVGSTLETLVLADGHISTDSHLISWRMHGFKVLKHMELSTVFFKNGRRSDESDDDEFDLNPGYVVRPLFKLLPPSLESFKLDVLSSHLETVQQLFRDFQKNRNEFLPRLSKVELHVRGWDSWNDELPDNDTEAAVIKAFADSIGLTAVVRTD